MVEFKKIASVELVHGCSWTIKNRKFLPGRPQLVTEDEIPYYLSKKQFKVEILSPKKQSEDLVDKISELIDDDDDSSVEDEQEIWTSSQLKSKKKVDLIKIGGELGVYFTGDEKKSAIVKKIMEAQEDV